MDSEASSTPPPSDADRKLLGHAFDPEFYAAQDPDLADRSPAELLDHYLTDGWRLGFDPNPRFSTRYYLDMNADVAGSGMNPHLHFLKYGQAEFRKPRLSDPVSTTPPRPDAQPSKRDLMAESFDVNYYLDQNPDVAESGQDPLDHFMENGWHEGRDPSADFSCTDYLEANPDVAAAGLNPFWHYLAMGISEGRGIGRHPGGYKAEILKALEPLEQQVDHWIANAAPTDDIPQMTADQLASALTYRSIGDAAGFLISIGHDDYRQNSGGVQLCIQREEVEATQAQLIHLNLRPVLPLPRLAHADDRSDGEIAVILTVDGQTIGQTPMSAVIAAFGKLDLPGLSRRLVIHSLLGHMPEQIADLAMAAGCTDATFWLHDFFSICPSFALQRNGVSFCNAPEVTSTACRICIYGGERPSHLARMAALFDRLPMQVIAPSASTRDLWAARSDLQHLSLAIRPHAALSVTDRAEPLPLRTGPARIAFVGHPVPHKGWQLFVALARKYSNPARFRFYYFGTSEITNSRITSVPAHVTADSPDAMIAALQAHDIDVVLHWATWPETFSFSTFEAIAAGAMILTNTVSGNVARTVETTGRGVVLPDTNALMHYLATDAFDTLLDQGRANHASQDRRLDLEAAIPATRAPADVEATL